MKKTVKILAVTLAAGMVGGLAACSSSGSQITLDSYWYKDNYEGIQNSTLTGAPEVLYYEITFEGEGNSIYSVEYDEGGYYQTTLTAATFDWSDEELTYADYRSNATEVVYVLTTEMYVSGRYVYEYDGSNDTVEFNDYVETVTYFRSARNTLSPLYSMQSVRSTSPNGLSPSSAADMCATVQYQFEVFYNSDASEATYVYTAYDADTEQGSIDDGYTLTVLEDECYEKTVTGLDDSDYTVLDNNTLYMAMRGMSLSSSFSAVVSLFTPAQGGTFDVSITGGDEGTLDTENETDSTIYSALTAAYGEPDVEEGEDAVINYNTVSVTSNASLSGTAQTAWYAAVEEADYNQYRATLLYLEVPLSYGLGTLQYTLTEVKSVLGASTT